MPPPFDVIPLLASLRPADRAALEPLCRIREFEKGDPVAPHVDTPLVRKTIEQLVRTRR